MNKAVYIFVFIILWLISSADAADIHVVIPANSPSRPAHFNWEFRSANGKDAQVGQFACGSYWVAPARGDNGVTLVSLTGSSEWEDLLSCDADPVPERMGLLSDTKTYGNYDPTENILPLLPVTYRPQSDSCVSLVAAIQRDEAATSKGGTRAIEGNVADAYCVVTIMPHSPSDGGRNMIRPNITGETKEFLTWNDFDLSRLPSYEFIEGHSSNEWESIAMRWRNSTEIFGISSYGKDYRGRPGFVRYSEGGRAFRSALLIDDYASGMACSYNDDVLSLFSSDNTLEEKKKALASMLSFGLDIYHARYDYGSGSRKSWSCGAGQAAGQFLPPVLLAALLKDDSKAVKLQKVAVTNYGEDAGERGPQELRQIKRGVTGVLLWGDGHPVIREDNKLAKQDWRYWADFTASKCYDGYVGEQKPNASKGQKTAADPYGYIDGPANRPGSAYMGVTKGVFRSFAAVMVLMPDVRRVVNSDAPIEYIDRLERHGLWTSPDPVAIPVAAEQDTASTWYRVSGAPEWGESWGPNPADVRFAIENGQGRFKSLHGVKISGGYESSRALSNWDKIISLYDGRRFEDNAVDLDEAVAPELFFTEEESGIKVYMFCAAPDADIFYTIDGRTPTEFSMKYDGLPVDVEPETVVKAIARVEGKKQSKMRSGQFID